MKRAFTIILILTLGINLISNAQSLPTHKEQYAFLKWYIKYRHLVPLDPSLEFSGDFSATNINSMLVSIKNKSYLKRQHQLLLKQFKLDSNSLKEIDWKTDLQSEDFINYFSFPIFSVDRKIVIINWGIYCGRDCGKESTDMFFKDKKNKWRLSKKPVPVIVF